ncbi:MAG TPA: N-acetyl-gamma-glutamyl-phosphate reductase [Myxococcota bacterium]|jgi:N-acetyl-gamma-glutamyl-phosphate reductase|nr:N-acetyl-gamma-glutamyl-phosphate reductase [Myxococcota bacterium]
MARPRVFVDGHVGTTGLRIREWLADREDLELLEIEASARKDAAERRSLANAADLVVLCLPDDAAREAVAWIENPATRVVDASTAHRIAPGWAYGLPELSPAQRRAVAGSRRVSNPGCYAITLILGLRPLVDAKILPGDAPITIHALSGYTGGGRSLIERWEDPERALLRLPFEAPYALDRVHKHVPEMAKYAGLAREPQFVPAVGPFATGMRVEIPLHASLLAPGASAKAIWELLATRYADEPFVRVAPFEESLGQDERRYDPLACNGTNRIELHVAPNPAGHVLLVGLLDNLGKGAAGSAIQNLNLMLGRPETTGLRR